MRYLLFPKTSPYQLPKIKRLIDRYSCLSTSDMDKRVSDMHALRMRLRLARSLILAANHGLRNVVSLQHYPLMPGKGGKRRIEAYAQKLSADADITDTAVMFRDSEILKARDGRLGIMQDELKRISEKTDEMRCASMGELETIKSFIEDGRMEAQGPFTRALPYAFGAFLGASLGLLFDRVHTTISRAVFIAAGAILGIAAVALKARRIRRMAIVSGEHIFSRDYGEELKELSKGFDRRYIAFAEAIDATMGKAREGLEPLLDNLLSQVSDEQRAKVQRDLEFSEAEDS
jgi:hypothetical protein